MEEEVSKIGVDLAKSRFQVRGIDTAGKVPVRRDRRLPARMARIGSTIRLSLAVLLAIGGSATAQESGSLGRETLPLEVPFDQRPVLVGDRLIWENHALLGLCQELGGSFRKLTGRREYACRLPRTVGVAECEEP